MSIFSLHINTRLRDFLTMTIDNDYDHFHGDAEVSALIEAVVVIVTSHRPEVKRYYSLILNIYLWKFLKIAP